jgi:membrane-associated phospholipid phosphatase
MCSRCLVLCALLGTAVSAAAAQETEISVPAPVPPVQTLLLVPQLLSCSATPLFGVMGSTAFDASQSAAGEPDQNTHAQDAPDIAPDDCPGAQQRSHTGFAALVRSTAADFAAFPRRRSTWIILGIGAGAAVLSHPADDDVNSHLVGSPAVGRVWSAGKVLGATYTQVGVGTGLYLVGRYIVPRAAGDPKTNALSHLGFDLVRAQIVSQAIVHGMKYSIRRDRPTGECCAFPSGHAATAFAVASVLERHLGYRAAWPTLAAAAYVGTSRLHDNRHFLSDVIFGSAVGVATGWTVVGRHGRTDFALAPVPVPGGIALALQRTY